MEYIHTILIDMDTCIKEQVVKNADDSYTIFVNAKLSTEQQKEGYKHALGHIEFKDFQKENVDMIEANAHDRD